MNLRPTENVVTKIALLLQQTIVGYRFCPTEEELINYLKLKVTGCRESSFIIPTLENIYEINPWDLPAKFNEKSIIPSKDQEWWFICPQMQNQRISRKTPCGSSWKITGKHKCIKARNNGGKIGSKITLVFPDGRNSKGAKSNWVMHELHPHPDNTGFVLCWLKMKQDENAENQEPCIQARGNQPNDAAMAKNGDIPSIPQFQCPEVVIAELSKKIDSKSNGSYQNGTNSLAPIHEDNDHFSPNQEHLMLTKNSSSTANSSGSFLAVSEPSNQELNFPHPFLNVDVCSAIEAEEEHTNQRKADLVQPLEEKEDEMSRTSNFIGEADNYFDRMDRENPEQVPFAEHQVLEMQNQLNELIMNGSSSSTEISSRSCTTVTREWSRIKPWMSPRYYDLFLNGDLFDIYGLISEPETEIGVSQYGQPKLSHSLGTEKIIPESISSDGVPALAEGYNHHASQTLKNHKGKAITTSFEKSPTKSQIQISSMSPVRTWTPILVEEPLQPIIPQESSPLAPQLPEETIMLPHHTLQKSEPIIPLELSQLDPQLPEETIMHLHHTLQKSESVIPRELSQLAPQSPEETIVLLHPTFHTSQPKPSSQGIELSSIPIPVATSGNQLKRLYSEMEIRPQETPPKSRPRFF